MKGNVLDSITKNVRQLYEKHPYPYADVKSELLYDLYSLIYYIFSEGNLKMSEFTKYSFFDAGCGSGQRVLGLASKFVDAKFIGVDMTEHSLEIAREQANRLNISNITFKQANLVDLHEEGTYDVVTSVGVIHHLSDPIKGLLNISRLIKEDGILVIHVYHTLGEHERMVKREIARTLQGDQSLEGGIQIMKELGYKLPINQYGSYGYNPNLTDEDGISKDVDVFLHPRVFTYRFSEGIDLFKETKLDWVTINSINSLNGSFFISSSLEVEAYALNPKEYLKSEFLLSSYEKLPLLEKLKVLECLASPTAFSLVAGKRAGLSKIGERLKNNLVWLKQE